MKKTIFLTGMPRANTTLMANILTNNPRIGGGETSPLLEYIYAARSNYSSTPEVKSALTEDIMYNSFINFCRHGINGYAESNTPKEIYLDKSRGWVHYAPFLWEINPNAKIILMIRDIRSVVSSLEKKWRDNPSILDGRDNPGQQQFITVNQRVDAFLNDPPLGIALKRIYNALMTGVLKNDNICVVHAEELAKNPKLTMEKIYEFIGEPYYDLDYNNVQQMTVENDRIADFGIYGDHKIRNKVEPLIKDYKEILGPEISNNIKSNFKWFYDAFGYF